MDKRIVLYLKNKKNYYDYLKENSFWLKDLNRGVSIKNFEEFIKTKYRLKTSDKINDAIDTLDLISTMINNMN